MMGQQRIRMTRSQHSASQKQLPPPLPPHGSPGAQQPELPELGSSFSLSYVSCLFNCLASLICCFFFCASYLSISLLYMLPLTSLVTTFPLPWFRFSFSINSFSFTATYTIKSLILEPNNLKYIDPVFVIVIELLPFI